MRYGKCLAIKNKLTYRWYNNTGLVKHLRNRSGNQLFWRMMQHLRTKYPSGKIMLTQCKHFHTTRIRHAGQ